MIKMLPAITKSDLDSIAQLARVIWQEHYPSIISLEQIHYMLEKFNSLEAIAEQVEEGVLFYYIIYSNEPVGFTAFKKENDHVFLRKLYILKAYRQKGIAKNTLQFIVFTTLSWGLNSIRLYVNKYNTNAVMAYEKP